MSDADSNKMSATLPTLPSTNADMIVFNDNPSAVVYSVNNNYNMSKTFPSTETVYPGSNTSAGIQVSAYPGQSYFDVQFPAGDTARIDLGTGTYSTSSTPETFLDGKSAVLLAPGKPLTIDVDYRLFFFSGPGLLPTLVNSFLQANLPALFAYVNQQHINIPVSENISVQITNVSADPQTFQCIYASTLQQFVSGNWYINTIFRIGQATATGQATIKGQSGDLNLTVSDAMMWIQLQFDPTFSTSPHVTQLQMSLGDYSCGGSIVAILETVVPLIGMLAKVGATPYRVAGAINNQFNASIISAINGMFKDMKPEAIFRTEQQEPNGIHVLQSTLNPHLKPSPALGDINLSAWMSTTQIQAMSLGDLKIPGSHDSATYDLSTELSQIAYPDIAMLWNLNGGDAPVNGKNPIVMPPTAQQPLFLGTQLHDWLLGVGVNSISRTQDLTITQQLQAGIRHFDFRVYYDSRDGDFYTQHALRGPSFRDILTQIQGFLASPESTELVFAYISHTNFKDNPDQIPVFTKLINSIIPGRNLYYQPVPAGEKQFDFQTLATHTVGSITNGRSKIMFINGDDTDYAYPDTVTNTNGYSGVPWTGEQFTVQAISDQQGAGLQKEHEPLWAVSWVLGANNLVIVQNILRGLIGQPTWALMKIAYEANSALSTFFNQYGFKWNLLDSDWFEYGAIPSVPEMVIRMNFGQ